MESVPTEEEAAEYLEQLAFEEEEEQILLSCFFFFFFFFFSGEEDIGDWYVCVLLNTELNNNNRENKRYDRMCLLSVYFKTNRFASAHKIVSVYRS